MKEQDRQIVNRLKLAIKREKKEPIGGINHYFIEEKVLPIIDRLDKQSTAMLALLERCKTTIECQRGGIDHTDRKLLDDIKTLPKEAKEVKHGKD